MRCERTSLYWYYSRHFSIPLVTVVKVSFSRYGSRVSGVCVSRPTRYWFVSAVWPASVVCRTLNLTTGCDELRGQPKRTHHPRFITSKPPKYVNKAPSLYATTIRMSSGSRCYGMVSLCRQYNLTCKIINANRHRLLKWLSACPWLVLLSRYITLDIIFLLFFHISLSIIVLLSSSDYTTFKFLRFKLFLFFFFVHILTRIKSNHSHHFFQLLQYSSVLFLCTYNDTNSIGTAKFISWPRRVPQPKPSGSTLHAGTSTWLPFGHQLWPSWIIL